MKALAFLVFWLAFFMVAILGAIEVGQSLVARLP